MRMTVGTGAADASTVGTAILSPSGSEVVPLPAPPVAAAPAAPAPARPEAKPAQHGPVISAQSGPPSRYQRLLIGAIPVILVAGYLGFSVFRSGGPSIPPPHQQAQPPPPRHQTQQPPSEGALAGRVLDARTGMDISGAEVLEITPLGWRKIAVTDANGYFEFPMLRLFRITCFCKLQRATAQRSSISVRSTCEKIEEISS
jgi:hypothetical protein